jgi:Fe-S-cluster containining protein
VYRDPQAFYQKGVAVKITAADCRSCGACCVAGGSGEGVRDHGYADVTPDDAARMSRLVRSQLYQPRLDGRTRYATTAKQLPSGQYACRYLRGTPGSRCSCSIYGTRPEICSTFVVGGHLCRAARLTLELSQRKEA